MQSRPMTTDELTQQADILKQRIDDGERRIAEAKEMGANTESWEEFWMELMHTYEAVCDQLRDRLNDGEPIGY